MRLWPQACAKFAFAIASGACTHLAGEDLEHPEPLGATWADITAPPRSAAFQPQAYLPIELLVPEVWVAQYPAAIRSQPVLARLAARRFIAQPQFYRHGIYGRVGPAVVYVAPRTAVPDWHHLYFEMVQVLSEKYGCFMRARKQVGNRFYFRCRDGRQVVMHRGAGEDHMQFFDVQFDRFGREIYMPHPAWPRGPVPHRQPAVASFSDTTAL